MLVCARRSFRKRRTQGVNAKNPGQAGGRKLGTWGLGRGRGTKPGSLERALAVAWQHTAHTVHTVLQPLMTSLQRPWSYWEHRFNWGGGKREYNELDLELFTFGTVEDFWSGYQCAPSLECVAVLCAASWLGRWALCHSMLPPHHTPSLSLPCLPAAAPLLACFLRAPQGGLPPS